VSKTTVCPQCHAQLPRRGRFCLECGADLYEQGVRRPPMHIIPITLVVLAFAGLAVYLALHEPGERQPPEYREVTQLTREVLRLAAASDYRTIVGRYYEPDAERYKRTDELLREIARGSGAPGLNLFRAQCMDDPEEAEKFIKKYAVEHVEYAAGLLGALAFQDGALRTRLGAQFGSERTLNFVAWYLSLAFGSVEPDKAEVADARWDVQADKEHLYVVTLRFPEPLDPTALPSPIPGVADPRRLVWRRLEEGKWVLTLGCLEDHFLLEDILALLQRVKT
jgi:hypothetical protein